MLWFTIWVMQNWITLLLQYCNKLLCIYAWMAQPCVLRVCNKWTDFGSLAHSDGTLCKPCYNCRVCCVCSDITQNPGNVEISTVTGLGIFNCSQNHSYGKCSNCANNWHNKGIPGVHKTANGKSWIPLPLSLFPKPSIFVRFHELKQG